MHLVGTEPGLDSRSAGPGSAPCTTARGLSTWPYSPASGGSELRPRVGVTPAGGAAPSQAVPRAALTMEEEGAEEGDTTGLRALPTSLLPSPSFISAGLSCY